jgi:hypothetical protein
MLQRRRGSLAKLLWIFVLGGTLCYGVVVALDPWSFHIGGRWTPLLTWSGSGELVTAPHASGLPRNLSAQAASDADVVPPFQRPMAAQAAGSGGREASGGS